ncbi:uncharacterized protein N7479_004050 [Penicillium vulpinum]|uniref:uncharacterized protein n=1 Tax=Penicillium vulpinum TaxID=29845 RepID=UPI0025476CE7|nr:uncharacterized protein N7479_004050 [Penicillium vulpinum]KAJ5964174.1 hypothetical protein N7479_004050 [Penicillium vulpinum]
MFLSPLWFRIFDIILHFILSDMDIPVPSHLSVPAQNSVSGPKQQSGQSDILLPEDHRVHHVRPGAVQDLPGAAGAAGAAVLGIRPEVLRSLDHRDHQGHQGHRYVEDHPGVRRDLAGGPVGGCVARFSRARCAYRACRGG